MGHKNWTSEEIEYLDSNWGMTSMNHISIKLRRSIVAIKLKAGRLGLGPFLESSEYITLNQLINALGLKESYGYSLKKWIKKGFPVKKKRVLKNTFKVVNITSFWNWAMKNKNEINFARFEKNALGAEPSWVDVKRKANQIKAISFKTIPWATAEDAKLITMLNQYRYGYKDISKALNRTEGAIKRRCLTLGVKQRPLKQTTRLWTDAEVEVLNDLNSKDYDFGYIANKLNRSALSCQGKYEQILNPEKNKRYYRRMMAERRQVI